MSRNRALALLLVAPGILLAPVTAQAQYVFTRIAESVIPFSSPASLNDAGQVAFIGASGSPLFGVFVGSGGPLTKIADTSGRFRSFGETCIDGNGLVTFFAVTTDIHQGIFAGPDGATTLLDDSGAVSGFGGDPHSSPGGPFTAIHAFLKNGGQSISVSNGGNGGPLTAIADTSSLFSNFDVDPRVNAAGQVVFTGDLTAGGSGVFTGNGGSLTQIADTLGTFRDFAGLPSINDHGDVVFGADLKSGQEGIFLSRAGQIQTVVDSSGAFDPGIAFGFATLNNRGQIAFSAALKTGNHPFGLFVGPDPVADRVLLVGDALDGSTVTNVSVFGDYFNNVGQLAFTATLKDGRTEIFRADPAPEPGSLTLLVPFFLWNVGLICRRSASKRRVG